MRRTVCALALCGALFSMVGCGGESEEPPSAADVAMSVDAERLAETWPVAMATEESFVAYAQHAGWSSLLMKRNYMDAVEQLGKSGGLDAARAHAELAALYRQAALLSANALVETYGVTPEATDPLGTQHLLTVSYALQGDLEKARAASGALGDVDDPTQVWHAPWKTWLAGDAAWPPDLSGLPVDLGEPTVGGRPTLGSLPHFSLPELGGNDAKRDMSDPSALVLLALWHDAAAKLAAGDKAGIVDTYRAGYRLPIEPAVAVGDALPMSFLFGSDLLVPGDGNFLADLHGDQGVKAIDKHEASSLLAHLAVKSRGDAGKMDAERAIDLVTQLRAELVEASAAKTGGEVQRHQRTFADVAYVGALRSLALVAEVEGDREVSGLLRINALERSEKATACPVGMLALGAWDTSNRYPLRAQDILHAQARRFPSLEAARYGLDVLALRVSRERTGETPGL
jgi:hypothetical protein